MVRWWAWAARAAALSVALSVALSLLAAVLLIPNGKAAGAGGDGDRQGGGHREQPPPPPAKPATSQKLHTGTDSPMDAAPALQLGAAGGYMFVRVPPSYFTGNFTIELWYRTATAARDGSGRRLALISNERHSADNAAYNQRHVGLYVEPSGALTGEFRAHDTREGRIDAGQLPEDGRWHHYALVRDKAARTLCVYIDGAVAGTPVHLPNGVDIEAQDQPVVLGGGNDLATHPGALDGVRFWTVPRTAHDMAAALTAVPRIHASDRPTNGPLLPAGLLVWYSFGDRASVSTTRPRFALDVAGSGIDAVLMHDATVVPAPGASASSRSSPADPADPSGVLDTEGLVVTSLFTQYNGRSMYGPDVNDDSNFFQLDH